MVRILCASTDLPLILCTSTDGSSWLSMDPSSSSCRSLSTISNGKVELFLPTTGWVCFSGGWICPEQKRDKHSDQEFCRPLFWWVGPNQTSKTIIMINCFVGGLSFVLVGYAFAFGSGNVFIGYSHFLILDLDPSGYAFFFFQVQKCPWISLSVLSL